MTNLKGSRKIIKQFYTFIQARHAIYVARFVDKKPAPWTDDPTLRDNYFCNVFRELDDGTKFYIEHIVPAAKGEERLLLHTILYRIVNQPKAWEDLDCNNALEWMQEYFDETTKCL